MTRTLVIDSPYDVNETLRKSVPARLRDAGEGVLMRTRRFAPTDRRGFQIEPDAYQQSLTVAHVGATRMVANATRRSMTMTVIEPNLQTYTFAYRTCGVGAYAGCGTAADGSWGTGFGILYREQEGARMTISDDHMGVSFELPHRRTAELLEALIERPVTRPIVFPHAFALDVEGGEAVARAGVFIQRELAAGTPRPESDPHGAALQDFLIRALLTNLPHNYAELLAGEAPAAAPFNVKRAKDFMRAQAHEPLTIEEIAAAAGCGVRSLQAAFQTFDDGSPMQRLRQIRLELARRSILDTGSDASVAEIAARYQFSNPGRFADLYRRTFGRLPSNDRER